MNLKVNYKQKDRLCLKYSTVKINNMKKKKKTFKVQKDSQKEKEREKICQ